MTLEGVANRQIARDLFRPIRPLRGERNGAYKAVEGVLYAEA